MRILVLSASTGNGHISAAKAIEAVCKDQQIHVRMVDALKYAPKAFQLWYAGGYELTVRRAPSSWGMLYKVSDKPNLPYHVQTQMDYGFLSKLKKLLREEQPDWVICTHSLPQPRLAELRKEFGFKMGIVVTDLYPHLMWLRGEPDWYFVPSEWTRTILEEREPGAGAITTVTGIPVHPVFSRTFTEEEVCRATGKEPGVPMITMTSGGIGGGPFAEVVKALTRMQQRVHLEVICGRNDGLRRDIEKRVTKLPYNNQVTVKVRGHINQDDMALRMNGSAFLISKPGGLTTSECLAVGCPMVVFHPFLIPGQEEGNAEFLVQEGAGVEAYDTDDLVRQCQALLSDPERLKTMHENARRHGRPRAANEIVEAIIQQTAATARNASPTP